MLMSPKGSPQLHYSREPRNVFKRYDGESAMFVDEDWREFKEAVERDFPADSEGKVVATLDELLCMAEAAYRAGWKRRDGLREDVSDGD